MSAAKSLDDDCGNCLLFGALQAIPDGVVLLDRSGSIVHLNAVALEILGLGSAGHVGKPFHEVLSHPGLAAFWGAAAAEEGTVSGEVGLVTGQTLRVSVAPCASASGEAMGRLLILRDVSEEKRIQVSLSADVARRLSGGKAPETAPEVVGLTGREREILALMSSGLTNAAIAERLNVSANTVASHIKNLYSKIRVKSRSEAAAFAVRHGITPSR